MEKVKKGINAVSGLLLVGVLFSWPAFAEQFGPIRHDGGKISCNDDRGPEIKQTQPFKAPDDRFFVEDSIKITKISGWGKSSSCSLTGVQKKDITVTSNGRTFKVPVITEFAVYAHADCGSGIANNSGGKTASVECSVTAEMQKYTND